MSRKAQTRARGVLQRRAVLGVSSSPTDGRRYFSYFAKTGSIRKDQSSATMPGTKMMGVV